MGSSCKPDQSREESSIFNPAELNFKLSHTMSLPAVYTQLLDRIKSIADFPDARENTGLKWFHSLPYDIYLYGDLNNRKPTGNCLFFLKTLAPDEELPALIATRIQGKNSYSPHTLIIYPDKSYYLGSILSHGSEPPRANGKGLLTTRKFIYEGEFKKGLPDGYGTFRSKGGCLVGQFREGEPHGRCVERTKNGLFIGELLSKFRKNGRLITPDNQVELVNEEYAHNGHTLVEL